MNYILLESVGGLEAGQHRQIIKIKAFIQSLLLC